MIDVRNIDIIHYCLYAKTFLTSWSILLGYNPISRFPVFFQLSTCLNGSAGWINSLIIDIL